MRKLALYRTIVLYTTLLVVFGTVAYSQGTSTDSLVLRNTSGGTTTLIPGAGVPLITPWYLTLPNNVGSTNSLLLSNVTGSNATLSWLAPGPDNTVLTMTAGNPQWVAGANWLLTGNVAVNELTQFMGTTDANDVVFRANNLIRMRINQEANQGIDMSRPTNGNAAYSVLNLGMNMQNGAVYNVANDNTRMFSNSVDFGSGGPGGVAQAGTFFSNWTRVWMQRAPVTTYNELVGYYYHWQANNAATINTLTGFWSERRSGATNNTVGTLYQFRAELPGAGTVNDLFGLFIGTPGGTLNNVSAFAANNIPTGTGNRYFLSYNATGGSSPFTVSADGSITSGTLTPLANSRMLITALPATSGRAIDINMTGTTTSSGLVVREIGATGSNDAGILIGTAAAGTGTGIRIAGVTGFNSPNVGVDVNFSSIGLNATPRSTANGVGVSVGTSTGNRARIGGEFYGRASATDAYGIFSDVNATASPTSLGVGAFLTTSGSTGSLFPLVVSSANNSDVYLGSTALDRPTALTTLLTGALTQNTTFMFNARISGSALFVGSTSGRIAISAPPVVTPHEYLLPATQGVVGAALRIQSLAGTTAQLAWTPEPPAPAPLFQYLAGDQTFAAPALANVVGLNLTPLIAGAVYEFEAVVAYDGLNVGADLQIAFVATNTTFIRWSAVGNGGASISPSSIVGSGVALTDIPTNATSFGNDQTVHIKGMFIVGVINGTLQMQAATTTAGNQVRILQGTFLKATRVSN